MIRSCIPDHSFLQWVLNIDNNSLVEQLDNRQTVESVKFDLRVIPEDFILNDNAVGEIYKDFSDLVYSEMFWSIPHHNVNISGNTRKKFVNKFWWTAELTKQKMIVRNAERDWLTDKSNTILELIQELILGIKMNRVI